MKKQELLQIHGLLAEIRAAYSDFEGYAEEGLHLEAYEAIGVRPTSVHKSKTDHRKAIFALVNGITEDIEQVDRPSTGDGGPEYAETSDTDYRRDNTDPSESSTGVQDLTFERCPPQRVTSAVDNLYDRHGIESVNTVLEGMYENRPLDSLYELWSVQQQDGDVVDIYQDVNTTLKEHNVKQDGRINPLVFSYGLEKDPNDVVSPRSYPASSGSPAD